MCRFTMVSELYLALVSRKLDRIVLSDGMCRVQNGLFGLLVQQIQLNWVARVDISVAIEVFALKQQNICFSNALLSKSFAMVHPMN